MVEKKTNFEPRKYMKQAIEVMNSSVQEARDDKVSPKVGAILLKPYGTVETAFRGEYREGDHAEYTLLDRINRQSKLDDCLLFVTLEPCAKGARNHPKMSCSERIVNARIKKIWIGIEDPDPTVDRKGIKYLIDNGVEVEMFDADLQKLIRKANEQFIDEAEERAKQTKEEKAEIVLSEKENVESTAVLKDFSQETVETFILKAKLNVKFDSENFHRIFLQLGLLAKPEKTYLPTGLGLLLFGKKPQLTYPNALIRATFKSNQSEDIETIEGPLTEQADKIQEWYKKRIGKRLDRSDVHRKNIYDYPIEVFREAIINAIVHRDYDIEGAPIYFEINDDAIIIKSPGNPVEPLTLEQIQKFSAPSLSRNPKIMYIFDQLELVEQRGLGFDTIKELPEKYGLPLPIVTFDAPYLIVTFPRSIDSVRVISKQKGIVNLSDSELEGFEWMRSLGTFKRKDYEKHFGFDTKKAERHISHMVKLKLLERKSSGPGTYYEIIATD